MRTEGRGGRDAVYERQMWRGGEQWKFPQATWYTETADCGGKTAGAHSWLGRLGALISNHCQQFLFRKNWSNKVSRKYLVYRYGYHTCTEANLCAIYCKSICVCLMYCFLEIVISYILNLMYKWQFKEVFQLF